jgi:hypothetical protein
MKVILSRKGFDSSAGECASPIFKDGSFLSLPIPDPSSIVCFADIGGSHPIGQLVEDLSPRVKASCGVHLDPDLRIDSRQRKAGWRPMFGQADAAQRHLCKMKIATDDVFLFFGWFRRVEQRDGRFRYQRGAPDLHIIFGWLKVGEIWRMSDNEMNIPDWAKDHPHVAQRNTFKDNTIYVAARTDTGYTAGTFRSVVDDLTLTRKGETRRSLWSLPKWFFRSERESALSYHSNPVRWTPHESHVDLQSVGRGQEFVLDIQDDSEAIYWVNDLIARNAA